MLKWVSSQQTISTTNKANNFNRNIVIVCGGLAITIGVPIAVYLMHRRRNNRHFRKEETNRRLEDNKVQVETRNSTPLIVQQNNSIIEGQQQMETTTIHHVEEKQQEAKMVGQSAATVDEETKKKVEGGTMQPESTMVVNVLTKPAMEVEVDGGADKQQNCEVNESGSGGGQMELVEKMSATGTPTKMLTQQPPPSSSTTTTSTPTVEKQHRLASLLDFILEQPQPEFNWAEAVEEAEESRKEFESSNQQGKEEELKLEKQNSVESDKMMNGIGQQQQMRHQEGKSPKAGMYSGRNSSSSQRQHPVNGICTCNRCMQTLNDLQSARGYKNAESPHSTHSEGSADSGRATGPLNSSSPFAIDEFGQQQATEILPIYEFEVPNTLVGLIIGIQGKTIRELCIRANVRMLIRPHHTPSKYDTHQICSVEGRRDDINKCLHMIRFRFPPCRFPDLNLKPVLPPPPTTTITARGTPTALTLPVGVPCEVYISAHVDAGHFFLQLPTHPSFSSLAILDQYMLSVYTQPGGAPEIPKPCKVGVLCTAPAYNGWFRAITLAYEPEQDEVLVRFVDYGGFARLPRADLRQIRTDFMNLPMQAIECYLANVQPIDGTSHWSEKANELFQQLCVSKIIQAALLGYCKHDGLPCVELYVLDENKKTVRVDQMLLERGLAKPADPTILIATNSSMSNSSASC